MSLLYRCIADVVVVLHFGYVLFIILGLLLILVGWLAKWRWVRNRWFRIVHLIAIAIVVVEAWLRITCPLTTWEQKLRELGGQASYEGAFVANAIHDLLFVDLSPSALTIIYSVFLTLVLLTFFVVPPSVGSWSRTIRWPRR